MTAPLILAGDRFKFLVATGRIARDERGRRAHEFRCDCGSTVVSSAWHVRNNKRQSCGCQWRRSAGEALVKHGHGRMKAQTAEYRAWCHIKARCLNPSEKSFPRYGGRGVAICDRWRLSFQAFLDDMGARPSPDHSIDRINNDGPYGPGNCRWATRIEQARNKRTSRLVTYEGEKMSLAEACERAGANYKRAHDRLQNGWSLKRALAP